MKVRGIVMPLQKNCYGFCDRLAIDWRYKEGLLRGRALTRMIEEGLLCHTPTNELVYDLARWGTAELSLAAREERRAILWPRAKGLDLVRLAQG
jgi:hypothetical protein